MKRPVLHFICLFLFTVNVYSQNTDSTPTSREWTLQQCIDYARQHNIQLSSLRLSSELAQQNLVQAENNRLPLLSGSTSQSWVHSRNTNPVVGGFQTQSRFSGNYGLNSGITLYNGGYLRNNIRANELSLQSARLAVEEAANDITLAITQAYLNILLSKENISAMQELLATSRSQMALGRQRYDAGSISRKDLLQFESQTATDEYNLINAQNDYRSNITQLKQLLQLPVSFDLDIVVPEKADPREAVPDLANARMAALASRPEITNRDVAVRLAEIELEKVRAGGRPTVNLNGALSSGFSDNQKSKYFTQLKNNFYQSVGLSASIPIFSRKLNKTNITKSRILIEQAKLDLENSRTLLNQQVEQAYISLQNALAQYAAAATRLKVAEETNRITNEQLRLGDINMTELLQQKNIYIQAVQAYLQARYTALLYNRIYRFYTGEPITF